MIMRRTQTATYWAPSGGAWGGNFASPEQITVRWEQKQNLVRDKEGREVISDATVYTGQEINPQGRLQLGVITGAPTVDASEPKAVSAHVTIHGQIDHWKVYL